MSSSYCETMRWLLTAFLPGVLLAATVSAAPATGRVVKVLPHFLDCQGRHTLSPSLYDRDAYQAHLRQHPEERSGLRFDIHWKAKAAAHPRLRVELRGVPKEKSAEKRVLDQPVRAKRWFGTWSAFTLSAVDCKELGEVTAWRVTLWDGEQLLDEERSFLW